MDNATLPDDVQHYIDDIPPSNRELFDRVDGLIREAFPQVELMISYQILRYGVGKQKLYVGSWKHGLSMYGWREDGGFAKRHPELVGSKGTIQLPLQAAATIDDDDLRSLITASLTG